MEKILIFLFLCITSFADTNINISPTNNTTGNQIDIVNQHLQGNYKLKGSTVSLTGQVVKDFNINRHTTYTTLVIEF
jgi:hypothetical protein